MTAPAAAATTALDQRGRRPTHWSSDAAHTTANRPKAANTTSPTLRRRAAATPTRAPMARASTTMTARSRGLSAVPTVSVAPRLRKPGVWRMTAWPTTATSDGTASETASTRTVTARATAAASAPATDRAPPVRLRAVRSTGRVSTFMPSTSSAMWAIRHGHRSVIAWVIGRRVIALADSREFRYSHPTSVPPTTFATGARDVLAGRRRRRLTWPDASGCEEKRGTVHGRVGGGTGGHGRPRPACRRPDRRRCVQRRFGRVRRR